MYPLIYRPPLSPIQELVESVWGYKKLGGQVPPILACELYQIPLGAIFLMEYTVWRKGRMA